MTTRMILAAILGVVFLAVVAGGSLGSDASGRLRFSTYLGGSLESESVLAMTVNRDGEVFLVGYTRSPDFPTTPGAFDRTFGGDTDAFVAALSADGKTLIFSTFLGGPGNDIARWLAFDSDGNLVVGGETFSPDFPTTEGAYDRSWNGENDAFVLKLNESGDRLLFSTFLGGSIQDWPEGFALDRSGDIYVTGMTNSPDFPTTPGALNRTSMGGFVARLSADGRSLQYGTYLGGTDDAWAIEVDSEDHAFVVGSTRSSDFPATSGAFDTSTNGDTDAFVAELAADGGSLVFATFLGGSFPDRASAVVIGPEGNVHVAGTTYSSDFPTTSGANDTTYNGMGDVFVVELNASGDRLVYGTFLGGMDTEGAGSLALGARRETYVVGGTTSRDFPVTSGALDPTLNGTLDCFFTVLGPAGDTLQYSTYLGGSDGGDGASTVAVDSQGHVYLAGWTNSRDFPTTPGAYDREIGDLNGLGDAFVLEFEFFPPLAQPPSLLLLVVGAAMAPGLVAGGTLLFRQWHLRRVRAFERPPQEGSETPSTSRPRP